MLDFKTISEENIKDVALFLQKNAAYACDLTVGEKLMWCDYFNAQYTVFNNTLIMRESFKNFKNAYHFPIGDDVDGAIKEIIGYSKNSDEPLCFYCLTEDQFNYINKIFPVIDRFNYDSGSDYIYIGEKFKTFSGKSLHGQKNHLNRFKKEHPFYTVTEIKREDIDDIKEFLENFKQENSYSDDKITENERCLRIIDNYFDLNFKGIVLKENGNVLGFAIVEESGDTLIIHIEKASKNLVGSYQAIIEAYSLLYINDKVVYINREDDAGDEGLRKSKQQYHPIELRKKYFFTPRTAFFALKDQIFIKTDRLTIEDWKEDDKGFYFNLVTDELLNKYWGFDYKDDIKGEINEDSVFSVPKTDKEKGEEYSLSIRLNNKPIGEFVFWNGDIFGGIEFGIRIAKEYQNKGFAKECYKYCIDYIKTLDAIKTVYSRCYKDNAFSKRFIISCGFTLYKKENDYLYYKYQIKN